MGGGGGGELLKRGVAVGGSRRKGAKLAVKLLNERLDVPPQVVGDGSARENAIVPLRLSYGTKSVQLARGRNVFPLQRSLEGLGESLPLWPKLILNRLSIPSGAVPREGAGLQQHVGGECG